MNAPFIDPAKEQPGWSIGRIVLQDGRRSLLFEDPLQVVATNDAQEVDRALRYIASRVNEEGFYAAGFMTYEASAAYKLATHRPGNDSLPLLWFGLYERRRELEAMVMPYGEYQVGKWQAALDWPAYKAAIQTIKSYIAEGHTYQVNYTMPLTASFSGDPWVLYRELTQSQQAQYMAYLDLGRFVICSASPELFFVRGWRAAIFTTDEGHGQTGAHPGRRQRANELAAGFRKEPCRKCDDRRYDSQ